MADYRVGFWNLENLFAPEGFPGREPWIANAEAKAIRLQFQRLRVTVADFSSVAYRNVLVV